MTKEKIIVGFDIIMNRTQPQPADAGVYTPHQHPALVAASRAATTSHLIAAADLMSQVFEAKHVPYAFMGGFSLKVRGSARDTGDVDIAVGCNMHLLKEVLASEPQ